MIAQDLIDDKSTLVQVMAWCRQATNHYLSQCWHSSLSLYGVTRGEWVKVKQRLIPVSWRKCICFDSCSIIPRWFCNGPVYWWKPIIGLSNSLAQITHQAIIWANDDPVHICVTQSQWVKQHFMNPRCELFFILIFVMQAMLDSIIKEAQPN